MKLFARLISFFLGSFLAGCVVDADSNVLTGISISSTATTIDATGSTTLTAKCTTTGSPNITYTWSITSSGSSYASLSSTTGSTVTLTGKNTSSSDQSVKVKVQASDGTYTYKENLTLTVSGAVAQISSVTISGSSAISYNGSTSLTAVVEGADNADVSYAWSISQGSSYASLSSTSGTSVTVNANNTSAEEQTVKIKVTATSGKSSCEDTFSLKVAANGTLVADEITGLSIAGSTSISADGSASLHAKPAYTGSPNISYTWAITSGSYASLSATSGSSVTLTANNTSQDAQSVTVEVRATDGTNSFTSTITIAIAQPSINSDKIYLNLSNGSASADNVNWTTISTSAIKPANNIKIKYTEDANNASTGMIKVNAEDFSGELKVYITGTMTSGGVKIQSNGSDMVYVYLTDTSITSSNYPCLDITKGSAATVTLSGTNTFIDGRVYGTGYGEEYSTTSGSYYTDDDGNKIACTVSQKVVSEGSDHKGTLYNKGNLTISGTGSLSITQAYKNCIASKEGILTIDNGTFTLKNYKSDSNTGKNGLFGGQGIVVNGGDISFSGKGIISSSDMRKANGFKTDDDNYTSSYVKITGGKTSITTYNGKGINAPVVAISGGENIFTVTGTTSYSERTSTGSWYDADGVKESGTVKFSPEGIESTSSISFSGGSTIVSAPDDGINVSNSGGSLTISGGFLYVKAQGDGLDSNGNITISGGITVVSQTGNGNSPIDCGDGYKFTVTGTSATIFVMGGSGMFSESIPSSTVSPMIYSTSCSGSSSLGVNGIIAIKAPQSYQAALLVSSSLTSGSSYSFVKGGTVSGTEYNAGAGVYFPASISGGTSVSCTATTQGGSGGGNTPGGRPGW